MNVYAEGRDEQEGYTFLPQYRVWACWEGMHEGCLRDASVVVQVRRPLSVKNAYTGQKTM